MLKNVFFKIMADENQSQKFNSLKNKTEMYTLFCENGYTKSFDEFEKEIDIFINSEDMQKLLNSDFDELSDEMLEMIAGGSADMKKRVAAITAGALTVITVGGILGSQFLNQSQKTPSDSSPSISYSASGDSGFNDNNDNNDNNGGGQTTNENNNEQNLNGPNAMKNRKGFGKFGGNFGNMLRKSGPGGANYARRGSSATTAGFGARPGGPGGSPAGFNARPGSPFGGPAGFGVRRGGPNFINNNNNNNNNNNVINNAQNNNNDNRRGPGSGPNVVLDQNENERQQLLDRANEIINRLQLNLNAIYDTFSSGDHSKQNMAYECLQNLNKVKQIIKNASNEQLSAYLKNYELDLDYLSRVVNDFAWHYNDPTDFLRNIHSNLQGIIDSADMFAYNNIEARTKQYESDKEELNKEYEDKIKNIQLSAQGVSFKDGKMVLDVHNNSPEINALKNELAEKQQALQEEYEKDIERIKPNEEIKKEYKELQEKYNNNEIGEEEYNKKLQQLQQKIPAFESTNEEEEVKELLTKLEHRLANAGDATVHQQLDVPFTQGIYIDIVKINVYIRKKNDLLKKIHDTDAELKKLSKDSNGLENKNQDNINLKMAELQKQRKNLSNQLSGILDNINRLKKDAEWWIQQIDEHPDWEQPDFEEVLKYKQQAEQQQQLEQQQRLQLEQQLEQQQAEQQQQLEQLKQQENELAAMLKELNDKEPNQRGNEKGESKGGIIVIKKEEGKDNKIEQEQQNLKNKLNKLELQFNNVKKKHQNISTELSQKKSDLNARQQDFQKLKTKIDSLEAERKKIELKYKNNKQQYEKANDWQEINKNINGISNIKNISQNEINNLKAENKKLALEVIKLDTELQNINNAINNLKSQLNGSNTVYPTI